MRVSFDSRKQSVAYMRSNNLYYDSQQLKSWRQSFERQYSHRLWSFLGK